MRNKKKKKTGKSPATEQTKSVENSGSDKQYHENTISRDFPFHLLPLAFILVVVPLIVFMKILPLDGARFTFWIGAKTVADFFHYYKAVFFLIGTGWAMVVFLKRRFINRIPVRKTRLLWPIAIYALLILISAFCSEHNEVALWGFVESFEGMFVLLAYLAILLCSMNLIDSKHDIKYVLACCAIAAFLIGLIGSFQAFGLHFHKIPWMKYLMVPPSMYEKWNEIAFSGYFTQRTYATFFNPNYVCSYTSLMVPILFGYFLIQKRFFSGILTALALGLILLCLYGTACASGIVGLAVCASLYFLLYRHFFLKYWKLSLFIIILAFGSIVFTDTALNHSLINRLLTTFKTSQNLKLLTSGPDFYLENILLENDSATIITNSETLKICRNGYEMKFYDHEGKQIPDTLEGDSVKVIRFQDPRYEKYSIHIVPGSGRISINIGTDLVFYLYPVTGGFLILGLQGQPDRIDHPERWGFYHMENFASGRAYVLSRSLPLLKHAMLWGYGPDTFITVFPQKDYVGKLNFWKTTNVLAERAHNMYLQTAINTGVLSLLAMLSLFSLYLFQSARLYFLSIPEGEMKILGAALSISICAYCFTNIFNDSVVAVAPSFWILLGTGIACNQLVSSNSHFQAGTTRISQPSTRI